MRTSNNYRSHFSERGVGDFLTWKGAELVGAAPNVNEFAFVMADFDAAILGIALAERVSAWPTP
ncbi:hypothetical protein GGE67_006159 [Rhizobium leucaenae]|nr:hypothetical protein [Rhizobium leucaenae]